jgi:hypothetical protein
MISQLLIGPPPQRGDFTMQPHEQSGDGANVDSRAAEALVEHDSAVFRVLRRRVKVLGEYVW